VAAVAIGGVLGAEARYGVDRALPHDPSQFPWSTVIINVSGSLIIGVVMVILLELTSPHRLARPFLGVGVLGGYTTYSTFAVDTQRLFVTHRPLVALGYVLVSVGGCLAAVVAATAATRVAGEAIIRARRKAGRTR
jgi:CrcB protein